MAIKYMHTEANQLTQLKRVQSLLIISVTKLSCYYQVLVAHIQLPG